MSLRQLKNEVIKKISQTNNNFKQKNLKCWFNNTSELVKLQGGIFLEEDNMGEQGTCTLERSEYSDVKDILFGTSECDAQKQINDCTCDLINITKGKQITAEDIAAKDLKMKIVMVLQQPKSVKDLFKWVRFNVLSEGIAFHWAIVLTDVKDKSRICTLGLEKMKEGVAVSTPDVYLSSRCNSTTKNCKFVVGLC